MPGDDAYCATARWGSTTARCDSPTASNIVANSARRSDSARISTAIVLASSRASIISIGAAATSVAATGATSATAAAATSATAAAATSATAAAATSATAAAAARLALGMDEVRPMTLGFLGFFFGPDGKLTISGSIGFTSATIFRLSFSAAIASARLRSAATIASSSPHRFTCLAHFFFEPVLERHREQTWQSAIAESRLVFG